MKIAHISDLHFTTFFKKNNLEKIKHILKYILEYKIDHLVITGDLTHNAANEDFEILRNLFKEYGLLNSERLSLAIGNHDIFGGPQTPEDIFLFPEKCRLMDYDKKVNEFGDFFFETFQYTYDRADDNYFPFTKNFVDVIIIGLNSIEKYSKLNNPFASNGKFYLKDFNLLADILNKHYIETAKKLIIVHHHFNKIKVDKTKSGSSFWQNIEKQTMKLKKKKKLLQLFNTYDVDLVLHGHIHETKEYYRKGIRFLNAGASITGSIASELKINFININRSGLTTEIHKIFSNTQTVLSSHINENNSKLFQLNN